jgi:hypothetical protein
VLEAFRLGVAAQSSLLLAGLLACWIKSLVPFAYERGGTIAGIATVVGFCTSLLGS